jgi:hypothetical protein
VPLRSLLEAVPVTVPSWAVCLALLEPSAWVKAPLAVPTA